MQFAEVHAVGVSSKTVASKINKQFQEWLDLDREDVRVAPDNRLSHNTLFHEAERMSVQLNMEQVSKEFDAIVVHSTDGSRIISVIDTLLSADDQKPGLLVVPYMPEKGRDMCREQQLSWIDLSGNAWVRDAPLHVHVEGNDHQYRQAGRPRSVFAPKSSLVSMSFLLHPNTSFTVTDLAEETDVDNSTVSRVTRRLESLGFIQQEENKGRAKPYTLKNPFTMLNAWVEEHDLFKRDILKGAIPESGENEFYYRLEEVLGSHYYQYAISGPRAANFYDVPAESSLTVAYVDSLPTEDALKSYGFDAGDRGANLWLVKPVSSVVYMETNELQNLPVVNPIQLYLDLTSMKAQRSEDLADQLYNNIQTQFEDAGF